MPVIGMPGCVLYNDLARAWTLSSVAGAATWSIGFPNDPGLIAVRFYQQALVLDPLANPFGAIVSNSASGRIGVP